MKETKAASLILQELARAESIHEWPEDLIHQVAIMSEEAGEVVQAANNHIHHSKSIDCVQDELIQTGATVIRCLKNLNIG